MAKRAAKNTPVFEEQQETKPERRVVSKYLQCPICYEGDDNGVGKCYWSKGLKRYYRCDRCSHNYIVQFESYHVYTTVLKDEGRSL